MLFGDNGIISRAQNAGVEHRGASVQEARDLWFVDKDTDKYVDTATAQSLDEVLADLNGQSLLTDDEVEEVKKTGQVTIGSRTIVFGLSIKALQPGDYVNYIVGTGSNTNNGEYTITTSETGYTSDQTYNVTNYTGYWQVLYGYETYGRVEITSSGSVGGLYLQGKTGYNNLVSTLNTMSEYYINATYATDARSIGSDPINKAGTSTYYSNNTSWMKTYEFNGKMLTSDETYKTDVSALSVASITFASGARWLASRTLQLSGSDTYIFDGRYLLWTGGTSWHYIYSLNSSGATYDYGAQLGGVQPVVCLRTEIRIVDTGFRRNGQTVWDLVAP